MLQELLDNLIANNNTIKLGLENIQQAAKVLKLQKPAPYVITIAGTNGKGSVITLLENLLVDLGYKTGCYTSPHLVTFNERVRINQNNISDQELIDSFNSIKAALETNNLQLTFFEFITLSAWQIFSTKNLDVLLLEIGLGGRLDAVNAIPKDLAIITSVDFDHQEYLGDDLESIGYEKAGIIECDKPVIYGDTTMPNIIKEIALSRGAELFRFSNDYDLNANQNHFTFQDNPKSFTLSLKNPKDFNNIRINNIATSLKALSIYLKYKNIEIEQVTNTVSKTIDDFKLIGRCSWLNNNKTILLDVAHNPQALKNLTGFLQTNIQAGKKIIALFGMLKDKNIAKCMSIINPHIDHWYLCGTNMDYNQTTINPRGTSAHELAEILTSIDTHRQYSCFDNITECCHTAYNFIEQKTDNNSILVIFGSFHIVGPAYDIYNKIKRLN